MPVGVMRHRLGELKEAEAALADAVAIWKQLAAEFPDRPQFRQELARSHNNLGILLASHGPAEGSRSRLRRSPGHLHATGRRLSHPPRVPPGFGCRAYNNLGNLLNAMGRLNEAEAAYADALARQKQLAADFPTRPEFRRDLAISHSNLGNLFQTLGR